MPANKRIRRPRARTTRELVAESAPLSASDLKKQVHRLEVEIAAASRLAIEQRQGGSGIVPSTGRGSKGYAVRQSLTLVQARRRHARRFMQTAMFLVSTCLLTGGAAWLYRFWQEMR